MKTNKKFRLFSLVLSIVIMLSGIMVYAVNTSKPTDEPKSLYEKVLKDHGFVYGINYYKVPGEMGDIAVTGDKCAFDETSLRCGLYNIKQIGFDAAQIWLFNRMSGVEFSADGDVTGVQDIFLKNLRTTCNIARETGIYLSFTIQPHLDYNLESGLYKGSKRNYDKYSRFITDERVRNNYIQKAVKPVLNVLKEYPDVVFSIIAYCEPEGDIYGKENSYRPWGTKLEVMTDFIGTVVKASREALPDVPVSVATGWDNSNTIKYFNNLDLDFLGMDIYDDYSKVKDLPALNITSPVMLTEFGPSGKASSINSYFHITNYQNFVTNAKIGGYTGAFYWCYSGKGTMQSLLGGTDYDYLPLLAASHYTIADNKNMEKGIEEQDETPVMLYPDTDGTIRFIASRSADTYSFERSADGKNWVSAGSIDANEADVDGSSICSYSDPEAQGGVSYYYRVTANCQDGSIHRSGISRLVKTMKTTCSESENLVPDYSFENQTDPKDGFAWYIDNSNDHFSIVKKTDENPNAVHSGNQAFRIKGNGDWSWVGKRITGLTPNTKYVFTFYAYADGEGAIHAKVLDDTRSEITKYSISSAHQNQWVKCTYIVDIGNNDTVILGLSDVGGTFNFDDFYFFEYVEE